MRGKVIRSAFQNISIMKKTIWEFSKYFPPQLSECTPYHSSAFPSHLAARTTCSRFPSSPCPRGPGSGVGPGGPVRPPVSHRPGHRRTGATGPSKGHCLSLGKPFDINSWRPPSPAPLAFRTNLTWIPHQYDAQANPVAVPSRTPQPTINPDWPAGFNFSLCVFV